MARYKKTHSGYMGQLAEWPEMVTEGETMEECMLRDALREMLITYRELGRPIPLETELIEPLALIFGFF